MGIFLISIKHLTRNFKSQQNTWIICDRFRCISVAVVNPVGTFTACESEIPTKLNIDRNRDIRYSEGKAKVRRAQNWPTSSPPTEFCQPSVHSHPVLKHFKKWGHLGHPIGIGLYLDLHQLLLWSIDNRLHSVESRSLIISWIKNQNQGIPSLKPTVSFLTSLAAMPCCSRVPTSSGPNCSSSACVVKVTRSLQMTSFYEILNGKNVRCF